MWIHNECSFIVEAKYENVLESACTWICPKCEIFIFLDSFFVYQLNLVIQNRFDPLTKGKNNGISSNRTNQTNSLGGLKVVSSSSIRAFRTCPCRNWKTTRNRFGLKYLQTKLLIMWQAGIVHLVAQVKTSNYFVISSIRFRNKHKRNKLASVHVLGDFNFKDIAWPDRLNKSGSMLSKSKGQMLIDIMNDHG